MKRVAIYLLAVVLVCSARAQFNLEIGMNFNSSVGSFSDTHKLGFGGYLEPTITFTEKFQLGFSVATILVDGRGTEKDIIESSNLNSYLITGTYKILGEKINPYIGLGFGVFDTEFVEIDDSGSDTLVDITGGKGGISTRAGIQYNKLNIGLAYHFIPDGNFFQFNFGVRIFE